MRRNRFAAAGMIGALALAALLSGCMTGGGKGTAPRLFVLLPEDCNTPDGATLAASGDIILSIPNFNNGALQKEGVISAPAPAKMVKIDRRNRLSDWYRFSAKDAHPDTGIVGPMGCDFGPDGNLYVADNQFFSDAGHKSRLLRINCVKGVPKSCDVVVEGFIVSNAAIWHGNTIYVSETILQVPETGADGKPVGQLLSGVYAIGIDEWKNGPVKLAPYSAGNADPHLIATYKTSNRIGFGADGLTFDGDGNLYCGIFEDGIVYKTTFPAGGKPVTSLFAKAPNMACCDGIFWREADNRIYVADMLLNGVQAVDMNGKVTTLHTNPDTTGVDGSLDQPCEVIVRGNELIIVNMDMPWDSELLTNKKIDKPYTLSVIKLK